MPNEYDYLVESFGDEPSGLPRLEAIALDSTDTFSVEGAFVDRTEAESDAALAAIRLTYQKHGVRADDLARMRALLRDGLRHANPVAAVLALVGAGLAADLEAALGDPQPEVRKRATETLGLLGRGSVAITRLSDPDPEVRSAAIRLTPGDAAWIADLGRRLDQSPRARERIEIVDALTRTRRTDAALAVLSRTADPDGDVRAHAAWRLQGFSFDRDRHDLPAIADAALRWLLVEPEPGIAANLLRHVPFLPHGPQALPALVALLEDASPILQQLAAQRLGQADGALAGHAAVALRCLSASKDQRTEIEAFRALATLGDGRTIERFAERLRAWTVQPGERGGLVALLDRLSHAPRDLPPPAASMPPVRPLVLDRATQPPPELSENEAQMLTDLGNPAASDRAIDHQPRLDRRAWWLEVLAQRLPHEPDAAARVRILEACDQLACPESTDVLLLGLWDQNAEVRDAAANRLRWKGGERVARATLERLAVETDPGVSARLLAHDALLFHAPEAAPQIEALCQHPDARVRAPAVAQLRALRFAGEDLVLPALEDPDPGVRAAAIAALEAIGSARALPKLRDLLATPAEASHAAALRKAIEWIEWRAVHRRPSHWN